MHDLAVIVVSTNEARWLRACLTSVFAHRGSCSLDVVVADNESTDGTADLVADEFPDARVVRCVNHGFAHANNRALMTTNARYALFLNPGHRDSGRDVRGAGPTPRRPPRRRPGGRRPADARRRGLSDDQVLPECLTGARSGSGCGAPALPRHAAPRTRAQSRPVRPGGRLRLDVGVVHARTARGTRVRGLPRRALLHLQRGARPLPAHQARRLEGVPPPGDDDRPLRGEGRDSSEDVGAGRLHANAARAKAFLARPPRLVRGRAGTRLRGASADAGPRSSPGRAPRRGTRCPPSARRYRGSTFRRAAGAGNPPASARNGVMNLGAVIPGATHCRFCEAPLELTVIDLGKSPLCESFLTADQLETMEPFYPLHVRTCSRCWLAQLPAFVAPAEIFEEYAYFSAFSDSWVEHARTYVEMISERLALTSDSLVVELASNDGYLLQHFLPKGIPVLGIDPAANVARAAEERGVETLVDFFGVELAQRLADEGRKADLVLGNNVLAQVPDLNDFVGGRSHPARRGRHRHLRVPASGPAARRAPVRHDLPRALLVLLSLHHPGGVRRARAHRDRRRGAADARRLASRLRGPRQRSARARPTRSGSSSPARSRRACATRSATGSSPCG